MADKKHPLDPPFDSLFEGKDYNYAILHSTIGVHDFKIEFRDKETNLVVGYGWFNSDVAADVLGTKAPASAGQPTTASSSGPKVPEEDDGIADGDKKRSSSSKKRSGSKKKQSSAAKKKSQTPGTVPDAERTAATSGASR